MKKFFINFIFFLFISTSLNAHISHYKNLKKIEMEIFRNNELIGYNYYFFETKENILQVTNQIKFTVKLLGATIFDVEGYGKEKYNNYITKVVNAFKESEWELTLNAGHTCHSPVVTDDKQDVECDVFDTVLTAVAMIEAAQPGNESDALAAHPLVDQDDVDYPDKEDLNELVRHKRSIILDQLPAHKKVILAGYSPPELSLVSNTK